MISSLVHSSPTHCANSEAEPAHDPTCTGTAAALTITDLLTPLLETEEPGTDGHKSTASGERDAVDLAAGSLSSPELLGPGSVPAGTDLLKAAEGHSGGWKVGPEDFTPLCVIGQGAFGRVLQVRSKLDEGVYAMKVISKRMLRKKNHLSYMRAERDIMTKVDFPFVVGLKFSFQTDEKLFLVMDYLSGGELFFHLRKQGLILEDTARFYVAEMVLALEHLHSQGIIHRDLKPENVLVGKDGHLCLTDFGLAKELTALSVGGEDGGDEDGARAQTVCGTNEYMCPEMILKKGYGKAADWWSLGALMYEMMAGHPPFRAKTVKDLNRKILHEKLSLPPFLTSDAHAVLKGLLERNVQKRLGATRATMFEVGGVAALKATRFFKKIDWQLLLKKQLPAPVIPPVAHECDTSNFDDEFTNMDLSLSLVEIEGAEATHSDTFCGFSFIESSIMVPVHVPAYRLTPAAKAAARLDAVEKSEALSRTGGASGKKKKKKKPQQPAGAGILVNVPATTSVAKPVEEPTVPRLMLQVVDAPRTDPVAFLECESGSTSSSATTTIAELGNGIEEEDGGVRDATSASRGTRTGAPWGNAQPYARKEEAMDVHATVRRNQDETNFPSLGATSPHRCLSQPNTQEQTGPSANQGHGMVMSFAHSIGAWAPSFPLVGGAEIAAESERTVSSPRVPTAPFSWSAVVAAKKGQASYPSCAQTVRDIGNSSLPRKLFQASDSSSAGLKAPCPSSVAEEGMTALSEMASMDVDHHNLSNTGTFGKRSKKMDNDGFVLVSKTKQTKRGEKGRMGHQIVGKTGSMADAGPSLRATASAFIPAGGRDLKANQRGGR